MTIRLVAIVAAGLVTAGTTMLAVPAGLICAGFCLAALGALFLIEAE